MPGKLTQHPSSPLTILTDDIVHKHNQRLQMKVIARFNVATLQHSLEFPYVLEFPLFNMMNIVRRVAIGERHLLVITLHTMPDPKTAPVDNGCTCDPVPARDGDASIDPMQTGDASIDTVE